MPQDITSSVLAVSGSQTRNGKTKYEVALANGQAYTTFDAGLAAKANGLVNQQVTARVEVKQKGQYTNYYLEDVGPVGSLPPLAVPAGAPVVSTVLNAPMNAPIPIAPAPVSNGGMNPEREQKIVKQSMLAAAANLVGHVFSGAGPEALAEAEEHIARIARGWYGEVFGVAQQPAQAAPVPATPQEVASQVQGAQVGVAAVETPPADQTTTLPWN